MYLEIPMGEVEKLISRGLLKAVEEGGVKYVSEESLYDYVRYKERFDTLMYSWPFPGLGGIAQ